MADTILHRSVPFVDAVGVDGGLKDLKGMHDDQNVGDGNNGLQGEPKRKVAVTVRAVGAVEEQDCDEAEEEGNGVHAAREKHAGTEGFVDEVAEYLAGCLADSADAVAGAPTDLEAALAGLLATLATRVAARVTGTAASPTDLVAACIQRLARFDEDVIAESRRL